MSAPLPLPHLSCYIVLSSFSQRHFAVFTITNNWHICLLFIDPDSQGKDSNGPSNHFTQGFVSLGRDSTPNPAHSGWKRDKYCPAYKSQGLERTLFSTITYEAHRNWPCPPLQFHYMMKFLNSCRIFCLRVTACAVPSGVS